MGKTKQKYCCVKGCKGEVFCRGLCRSCYASLYRLVRLERTTWQKLEKEGLAMPVQVRGAATAAYLAAMPVCK